MTERNAARPNVPGDRLIFLIAAGLLTLLTITGVACKKTDTPAATDGDNQTATGDGKGLLESVQDARHRARREMSKNNLKMIGLALHNYHDTMSMFPPGGIYAVKGDVKTPHNSWETMILPSLGESRLYNNVDFHEPWNTPKNADACKMEVKPFLSPIYEQKVDENGFAVIHYAGNKNVFLENRGTRIRDFRDGTSNTMLIGEINDGFMPWGQPGNWRDLALGLEGGKTQFGSDSADGVQILLADGSVRTLAKNTDKKILQALATPAGGEAFDPPWGNAPAEYGSEPIESFPVESFSKQATTPAESPRPAFGTDDKPTFGKDE